MSKYNYFIKDRILTLVSVMLCGCMEIDELARLTQMDCPRILELLENHIVRHHTLYRPIDHTEVISGPIPQIKCRACAATINTYPCVMCQLRGRIKRKRPSPEAYDNLVSRIRQRIADSPDDYEYLTTADMSKLFGISKESVGKWVRVNKLPKPTVKRGCANIWRKSDLKNGGYLK